MRLALISIMFFMLNVCSNASSGSDILVQYYPKENIESHSIISLENIDSEISETDIHTPIAQIRVEKTDCAVARQIGGDAMCNLVSGAGCLLGAGAGLIYLYIKVDTFLINSTLGFIIPPILAGFAIGGTCGTLAGCYVKHYMKNTQS